ncbi:ABC transporter permease [candidate division KSB3 bacterium]|uniref:ABC transporter permease n=1 Tax=candidate division KSB3 bacterium TaxID=2044937 RepID=A0A9D5JYF6_9BACT|nr:ABC transporter permease [candidate division KSB3 bacterium]MBD3326470.1 ABC transporter permease [candidate division KSB3 bacterium]
MEKKSTFNFLLLREIGVIAGTIILFVIFAVINGDRWISIRLLRPLLHTASLLGVMVVGQALLIISGEFDLSVGSVFGLAGVSFIALSGSIGVIPAFLVVMVIAGVAGFLNGLITLRGGVPSLITTLGSLFIYRGLVYFTTAGFPVTLPRGAAAHPVIRAFGGRFLQLNNSLIWCLLLTLAFSFILQYTVYGNRVFGAGGDPRSAWAQGVKVNRVKWTSFIICSMLAAFAGVLAVTEMKMGSPTLGQQMELQTIASSVIGGIMLTGGIGSIWGGVLGALMLSMISSGLILMGAPAYWFITFVGIVLILGVMGNNALMASIRRRFYR